MPQIIVTADPRPGSEGPAAKLTERVTAGDFESPHFRAQLVERLSWAVGDAHAVEQQAAGERQAERERPARTAHERQPEHACVH